jgi:PTS system mannose-specific IID component
MSRVSKGVVTRTFLRSLVVQGAWNYHTMLGTGFAFALLPGLRRIHHEAPGAFDDAVRRHLEHFNAHPYLTGLALGATLRLEEEGEDPETIARFKTAVRGPLGSLGDQLVWARWLPLVALGALVLYWLAAPWWLVVALFLVTYNVGHLGLRAWGLRTGIESGREVARTLGKAKLGERAQTLATPAAAMVGVLFGVLLVGPLAEAGDRGLWVGLSGLGFAMGLAGGHRVWRPAAAAVVAAVVGLLIMGVVR